jgi:hypothetical protein
MLSVQDTFFLEHVGITLRRILCNILDIDIIWLFWTYQVIAAIAGVAYLLDRGGKFRKSFAHRGDHILSMHPVLFYYCIGRFIFYFSLQLISVCANEQCLLSGWILYDKYHILHVSVHQFVSVNSVSISLL